MPAPGKWSNPEIPHSKWECVDVEDLGPLHRTTCGMCEVKEIRYVHTMRHPVYGELIYAGCVCAGKMEGSYEAAKNREVAFASRKKWLKRKWKESAKGNPYLKADHLVVTVFPTARGFKAGVKLPDDRWIHSAECSTQDGAKLAGFELWWKAPRRSQENNSRDRTQTGAVS